MENTLPSGESYRYDAFISYRHLPLDMAVASRLQELLENYRPPKQVEGLRQQRITRVFRDTSELPTSGDLGNDISEALKRSRFLIVICSEQIRDSRWCMEEINLFKKYHNGRTNQILPLLVSGEPGEVFPEQLLTETRTRIGADGVEEEYEAAIEPLCADVRADTVQKSLKRLKTEFLRIAAPILGCSFDTLYQRHLRRQKRRNATVLSASIGLLSAVLLVVSAFAYRTWVSEREYRATLAENYIRQGSEQALADRPQQALLYFSQALSAAPEELPAGYAGAALLLQDYAWPVREETLSGAILNGSYSTCTWAQAELDGQYFLRSTVSALEVCDRDGNVLREIALQEGERATLTASSAGQWAFCVAGAGGGDGIRFLLYDPAEDRLRSVEMPSDTSRSYDAGSALAGEYALAAIDRDRAVLTGGGLVRLIEFDASDTAQTLYAADLADAFPLAEKGGAVSGMNKLWISADSAYIAVRHQYSVAVYQTDGLVLCGTVEGSNHMVEEVVFSGHDTLAVAWGDPYSLSGGYANPGGMFGVYRINGETLYQSEPDQENAFSGVAFAPGWEDLLLVWSQNMATVFDLDRQQFVTAPLYCPNITAACFNGEDGVCVASSTSLLQEEDSRTQDLTMYRYLQLIGIPADTEVTGDVDTLYASDKRTAYGPDGKTLVCSGRNLTLCDSEGQVLASREIPVFITSPLLALSEDGSTVYMGDTMVYSGLACAAVDFEQNTIGPFTVADTDGSVVLNLWALGANAAMETSSRRIMIFQPDGTRIFSALPQHNSMPVGIVTDPRQRYMALYLKETAVEQGVLGYEQNSYLEVWDIASGVLLADYEVPGKDLQTLAITRDGVLVWGTRSGTCSRAIPTEPPDEEALAFLTALCGLSLNEQQQETSQTPVQGDLSDENWYTAFGEWQYLSFRPAQEETVSFAAQVGALADRDDFGSAVWITDCDQLWRDLAEGRTSGTVSELDTFFALYSTCAVNKGGAEQIGYGLETYLDLCNRAVEESEDIITTSMESYLLPILCETTRYDEQIAEEFLYIADSNEAEIRQTDAAMQQEADELDRFMWEEIDRPSLELVVYQMRAWAACLTGGESQAAWQAMAEACGEEELLQYPRGDALAVCDLLAGQSADAAATMNAALADQVLGLDETERQQFADYFSEHLEFLAVMLYREQIDPAVLNDYLQGLHASFGIQVVGVGAEAQGSGIQLGDTIIAIDGQYLPCAARAKQLLHQPDAVCTVVRDGRTLQLPVPEGLTYQFFCTLS